MFRIAALAGLVCLCFSLAAVAQNVPTAPGAAPAVGPGAAPGTAPAGVPGPMPGGMTPDMHKMMEQMQQQILARFDVDRNGVLSDQEKLMAQEAMRREGINLGIPPGGFPGADQFLKQFDRDGDGKLNPLEAMAAQEAYQRARNGGMGGGMRGGLRGGVGGGGGGGGVNAIPPQPAIVPQNAAGSKATKSGNALVQRFDKDGDGKLNAEEKAAAQAELKKDKAKPKDAKPKT